MPHPFNFAYPVQCSRDAAAIQQLFNWTTAEYGITVPPPNVLVVNHEHMQRAASRSSTGKDARKHVLGWYTRGRPFVYFSDRLKPSRRVACAGIVVHEFIHHIQDAIGCCWDVTALEEEADRFMMKYVLSPLTLNPF